MAGRIFNISSVLIKNNINDSTFMDLISVYAFLKYSSPDSRMWFKTQLELLQKLHIGHSRFKKIQKHKLFTEFFKLGDGFIVARKNRYNKIQLTFGIGEYELPSENRIVVGLDKNKVYNIDYIKDQIRVAVLVNEVIVMQNYMYGGETKSSPSFSAMQKEGFSYADVAKLGTASNRILGQRLGCSGRKAQDIVKMAEEQGLIKKKNNVICLTSGLHSECADYIMEQWHNLPESSKVGGVWKSDGNVFWQIANSYTTVVPNAKNRHYFGQKEISLNHYEETDKSEKVYDEFVDNMREKSRKEFMNFLGMEEAESVLIKSGCEIDMNLVVRLIKRYLANNYPQWEGLDSRRQNEKVRIYRNTYKKEEKTAKRKPYFDMLKKGKENWDLLPSWDKDEALEAIKRISSYAEKAGVKLDTIVNRVGQVRKSLGIGATVDQAKEELSDMLIKKGKVDYAQGVMEVADNVLLALKASKYDKAKERGQIKEKDGSDMTIKEMLIKESHGKGYVVKRQSGSSSNNPTNNNRNNK